MWLAMPHEIGRSLSRSLGSAQVVNCKTLNFFYFFAGVLNEGIRGSQEG